MADAFDERENAYEKRFANDEELRFRAVARRNRALGAWAAERLGLSGDKAAEYAQAFVGEQVGRDDDAVAAALSRAFADGGVEVSSHRVGREIAERMASALASVRDGA